jgi:hypothetical protein
MRTRSDQTLSKIGPGDLTIQSTGLGKRMINLILAKAD